MTAVPGPPRFQPPPYATVADLMQADDLPHAPLGPTALSGLAPQRSVRETGPRPEEGSREPLGHRVTRRFLTLCEHPRTRARTMSLVHNGADSAVGGRLLIAYLSRRAFGPVLRSRRLDHTTARIELACAQLGGIAVLRYVTEMEPVASMSVDDLVAMVGPAVDATLTAPYSRSTTKPRSPRERGFRAGVEWIRQRRR